jgi:adenine phosphoribosyltransferase
MSPEVVAALETHIRDIPDFPEPGVVFKDITPLLADGDALRSCIEAVAAPYADDAIDKVVGVEARGFILASPVAASLGVGFVPVRKPGKLPWEIEHEEYSLEYGTDRLEIHRDAVGAGERVLVVDDVMATGGTAAATARLVERLGGEVVGFSFLIELEFLAGRALLPGRRISSVLTY